MNDDEINLPWKLRYGLIADRVMDDWSPLDEREMKSRDAAYWTDHLGRQLRLQCAYAANVHETLEVVLRGLVEIWSQWPRAPEVTESKYWEAVADSATKDLTDTEVLFTLLGSQWDPKLKEGRLSALITSCGASCQSVSRQRSRRCSNGR